MKIDGRKIATKIYNDLKSRVGELKKKNMTPHLAVFLIGKDPASIAYVNQKQKWGKFISAQISILRYPASVTTEELVKKINALNDDPDTHAILIQRPLPPQIETKKLELMVEPQKDVDGFHPDSPHTMPLALAVLKILEKIHKIKTTQGVARTGNPHQAPAAASHAARTSDGADERSEEPACERCETGEDKSERQAPVKFIDWLKSKNIVLLGKGATGGSPIIKYFHKLGISPTQIDSKTLNPNELIKKADIVISAVGKPNIITPEKIKKGAILIGVGIFRGEDGKLNGDYNEKDIKNIAGFYTPTPGGVGPVNVAMLLNNVIKAAEKQSENH